MPKPTFFCKSTTRSALSFVNDEEKISHVAREDKHCYLREAISLVQRAEIRIVCIRVACSANPQDEGVHKKKGRVLTLRDFFIA